MGNMGAVRANKQPPPIDVMVMRIVTRFTTAAQFVSGFRKFCGVGTCFIPSAQAKRIGVETGFSIRLADGTPMLRGLCVVLDSWPTADNPYERPGVRLGIRGLTAESKLVFQRLLIAGTAAKPEPDEHTMATIEMEPLFPAEELFDAGDAGIDRNESTTRKIEMRERIEMAAPEVTPLEGALAAAAAVRLDGSAQRIERLESQLARARELADDHTTPTKMPPEMLATAASDDAEGVTAVSPQIASASSTQRSTILGVMPLFRPMQRARVSMPALTERPAPSVMVTPFPAAPAAGPTESTTELTRPPVRFAWWRRVTVTIRGWYKRRLSARRRRRAALHG